MSEAVLLVVLAAGAAVLLGRRNPGLGPRALAGTPDLRRTALLSGCAVAVVSMAVLAMLGALGLRCGRRPDPVGEKPSAWRIGPSSDGDRERHARAGPGRRRR